MTKGARKLLPKAHILPGTALPGESGRLNLATQLPSPLPATAGLLCFGRYVETLGEPAFLAPPSNAEKKAAKEARRREKEAAKEAARKKAEAAAAEAEANKGETPAEKKTRLAREDKVKQMLFNLDQDEGSKFFMVTYRRLAVRIPHFCRALGASPPRFSHRRYLTSS